MANDWQGVCILVWGNVLLSTDIIITGGGLWINTYPLCLTLAGTTPSDAFL